MTTNDRGLRGPDPEYSPPELRARLSTSVDGTTELTLYPEDAAEGERVTTWISAAEDSFVDSERLR